MPKISLISTTGILYELADRSLFRESSSQIISKTAGIHSAYCWAAGAALWVGFIFFSSTSLAGLWSERLYVYLSRSLFGQLDRQTSPDSLLHLVADKGFHVFMFFVLACLLWKAIPFGVRKPEMIILTGTAVGGCSELLQRLFPDRDPAVRDWLINIGGTTLGMAVCWTFVRMQSRIAFSDPKGRRRQFRKC